MVISKQVKDEYGNHSTKTLPSTAAGFGLRWQCRLPRKSW
jgi:hypothetical protein